MKEFLAYQIMYLVFCGLDTEVCAILKQLTYQEKCEQPLQHALEVRKCLSFGNYRRFFKLYNNSPNKSKSLIDVFIDKIRILCLRNISVGYVATGFDLLHLTPALAFSSPALTEKFLLQHGCKITETADRKEKRMDCRESIVTLRKTQLEIKRPLK